MKYVRKALLAAAFAAAAAVGTAMLDGELTQQELMVAGGTGLLAGYATYQLPNAKKAVPEGEAGIMAEE